MGFILEEKMTVSAAVTDGIEHQNMMKYLGRMKNSVISKRNLEYGMVFHWSW